MISTDDVTIVLKTKIEITTQTLDTYKTTTEKMREQHQQQQQQGKRRNIKFVYNLVFTLCDDWIDSNRMIF